MVMISIADGVHNIAYDAIKVTVSSSGGSGGTWSSWSSSQIVRMAGLMVCFSQGRLLCQLRHRDADAHVQRRYWLRRSEPAELQHAALRRLVDLVRCLLARGL